MAEKALSQEEIDMLMQDTAQLGEIPQVPAQSIDILASEERDIAPMEPSSIDPKALGEVRMLLQNALGEGIKKLNGTFAQSIQLDIQSSYMPESCLSKARLEEELKDSYTVCLQAIEPFFDVPLLLFLPSKLSRKLLSNIVGTKGAQESVLDSAEIAILQENMSSLFTGFLSHLESAIGQKLHSKGLSIKDMGAENSYPWHNSHYYKLQIPCSMDENKGLAKESLHMLLSPSTVEELYEALQAKNAHANDIIEESTGPIGQPQMLEVSFPSLDVQIGIGEVKKVEPNMNLLMDVQMTLTVELGRTRMFIKEILSLGEGSIIELDKLAGEPVDLLVNGKLVAKGEVVVIDENFGVRVTDIVSPAERLRIETQEKA